MGNQLGSDSARIAQQCKNNEHLMFNNFNEAFFFFLLQAVAEGEPSPKYPWNAPVCEPSSGFKCADGSNKYEVVCSLANQALITSGGKPKRKL